MATLEFEAWLRDAGKITVVDEGEQMLLAGGSTRMYRLYNAEGDSRLVSAETAEAYGYKPTPIHKPLRPPQTSLFGESGFIFGNEV
jgi:hypothetical protein